MGKVAVEIKPSCPECGSTNVGRFRKEYTRKGVRMRYRCKACGRTFAFGLVTPYQSLPRMHVATHSGVLTSVNCPNCGITNLATTHPGGSRLKRTVKCSSCGHKFDPSTIIEV